jgi:hypothetical protein
MYHFFSMFGLPGIVIAMEAPYLTENLTEESEEILVQEPRDDCTRNGVKNSEEDAREKNHRANDDCHRGRVPARRPNDAADFGYDLFAPCVDAFVHLKEDERRKADHDRKAVTDEILRDEAAKRARRQCRDRFEKNGDEDAGENAAHHKADRDRLVRTALLHFTLPNRK